MTTNLNSCSHCGKSTVLRRKLKRARDSIIDEIYKTKSGPHCRADWAGPYCGGLNFALKVIENQLKDYCSLDNK